MKKNLAYLVAFLVYVAVIYGLAVGIARAEPYGTAFGGTCFQPADADLLTKAFGKFDIEIVEAPNSDGYAIIKIIGEKARGVAAIMPTTDICVLWTSGQTGDPA